MRSKIRRGILVAVTVLGVFASGLALAQDEPRKAVQRYDFDDDMVTAGFDRGDGTIVQVTRKPKISSLIEVRKNFIPELLKSAEDI